MPKYIKLTLLLVMLAAVHTVSAQLNYDFTEGKFMIKGQVVDIETKAGLPMANIKITNNGKGVTCDNEGNFTLYVSRYDTLRVSYMGHIPKVYHIYDLDSTQYYTLRLELIHDFVKLGTVTIYPYKDKDEFRDAFLAAKDVNKVTIPGIAPPKYSNKIPKAKLTNPVSFLYDKLKKKRSANPDFRP